MRHLILSASLLLLSVNAAQADVSFSASTPNVSIGINVPAYPHLVAVPGYPVYYAPQVNSNYFYYDHGFWVFNNDYWYTSAWYDGPWTRVEPAFVPVYVLRVPVSYYRRPPPYFHGWAASKPPRWDTHWGHEWSQRHAGWERWDHQSTPPPAPLPNYQRDYPRDHYPRDVQQQRAIRSQHAEHASHASGNRDEGSKDSPGKGHGKGGDKK